MTPTIQGADLSEGGSICQPARSDRRLAPLLERCLVLLESRELFRQCIVDCLNGPDFRFKVCGYSSWSEMERDSDGPDDPIALLLSFQVTTGALERLVKDVGMARRHLPEVPVIVLADSEEPGFVRTVMSMGVKGYVPTSFNPAILKEVIHFVRAGGVFVPATVLQQHVEEQLRVRARGERNVGGWGGVEPVHLEEVPESRGVSFTRRESEVAARICDGKSNKLIARELSICEGTVKVYVQRIMRKLSVENRTQAALAAISVFEAMPKPPSFNVLDQMRRAQDRHG